MKTLQNLLFLLLVFVIVSCSKGQESQAQTTSKRTATITGTNVNVRSQPSVDGKVVQQLQPGMTVQIEGQKEEMVTIAGKTDRWYEVSGNFGQGWVFGAFMKVEGGGQGEVLEDYIVNQEALCAGMENYFVDCAPKIEKAYINKYPGNIRRNKGELSLKLDNGTWKKFEDNDSEYDFYKYHLDAFLAKTGVYLIVRETEEWSGFFVVSGKTGNSQDVFGLPAFSPSAKRFISYYSSVGVGGGNSGGFQVWNMENGNFIMEYEFNYPMDNGIKSVKWLSDNDLVIEKVVDRQEGGVVDNGSESYKLVGGVWKRVR